jgi:hypothetical protein
MLRQPEVVSEKTAREKALITFCQKVKLFYQKISDLSQNPRANPMKPGRIATPPNYMCIFYSAYNRRSTTDFHPMQIIFDQKM